MPWYDRILIRLGDWVYAGLIRLAELGTANERE